jgi:hypothetical protein
MTTRRIKILRELRQFHGEWPNSWLGARDITVFRRDAEGFAAAAGELLAEGLILRTGGEDPADVGYRLNWERRADLRRELLPPVRRVVFALVLSILIGVIAALMMYRGL